MTSLPHKAVGSSVGGGVISLWSSSSMDGESRGGPYDCEPTSSALLANAISASTIVGRHMAVVRLVGIGPQPSHVILCRRVIASSFPTPHVSSCGVKSLVLLLLAMVELRGRLEASRSAVRTSDARIAGLQARLAIMEAHTASTPLTPLLVPPYLSGMLRLPFFVSE